MKKINLNNLKTLKLSSFVTAADSEAAKIKGGCTWTCTQSITPDACH